MKFLTHFVLMFLVSTLGFLGSQQTHLTTSHANPKTSFSTQKLPSQTSFSFVELEETEDDFQDQISPDILYPDSNTILGFAYLLLILLAIRLGQSYHRTTPIYLAFENLRI